MKLQRGTLPLTDPCCFGRVFLFMDVATPCRVVKIGFRVRKWNDHVISSGFVRRQPAWYTIRRCANILFFIFSFLPFSYLLHSLLCLFPFILLFHFLLSFIFSSSIFFSSFLTSLLLLLFSSWTWTDNIISWISSIFSSSLFFCSIFLSFLLLSIWNWTGNERNIFTGNDSFTKILVIAHQAQRHALNYFHECLTSYAIYSSSVVSSLCHDDCQYKALLFLIMTRTLNVGDSFLSKECSCIIIIYNLAFRIFLFLSLGFFL